MNGSIGGPWRTFDTDRWMFSALLYNMGWECTYMAQAISGHGGQYNVPSRSWIPSLIEMITWDADEGILIFDPQRVLEQLPSVLWSAMWYAMRTGTTCQLAARIRGHADAYYKQCEYTSTER